MSAAEQILRRMSESPPGKVWTARDFVDLGTRSAIDVALHRLSANGRIRRVDQGLYDIPRQNRLTKKPSPPDYKSVIDAVARRDGSKVLVDGITAANNLGLTNAVPAKVTVWTDARVKPINLGDMRIDFKTVAPSRLVWAGRPAASVVQALIWLRDALPSDQRRVRGRLEKLLTDPTHGRPIREDLAANLGDIPSWLLPIVKDLLQAVTEPSDGPTDPDAHSRTAPP